MKISIITVCKNSENAIERTVQSVLEQTYNDIEYIVIDGSSTDSTLSIIEKYKDSINVLISEKDSGIYSAMNKALGLVNGDVVYFLNSDDFLFDNKVLSEIAEEFKKDNQNMILHGNVVMSFNGKNTIVRYDKIRRKYFYKHTICHQALFIKKKLFEIIGNYDEKYQIHADTDWLLKAYFKIGAKFKYIDRIICYYSTNGFSGNKIIAEKYKFDRQVISAQDRRSGRVLKVEWKFMENFLVTE
jgi:glycosyltransferase involved in cell wall biosynthesis